MNPELLLPALIVACFIGWRSFNDALATVNTNRTATHVNALISLVASGVAAMCAVGLLLPYVLKK